MPVASDTTLRRIGLGLFGAGNLAASAWCLLAPAAVCIALSGTAPRWMRITSGTLAVLLIATVALPPVSWPFGMLWVIVTSVGLLSTTVEVTRGEI